MKPIIFILGSLLFPNNAALQDSAKTETEKRLLSDSEVQEFGKLIAKYYKSREPGAKDSDIVEKINTALANLQKKKKINLLKHAQEWEPILDLADDYSRGLSAGSESMQDGTFGDGGPKFKYGISVPKKYSSKTAWPLLIVLPDNPEENPKDFIAKNWNHESIKDNFIICAPQMSTNLKTWTEPEGYGVIFGSFGKTAQVTHIDCNRVFIAGSGKGAKVAALMASYFPARFAGVICRGDDLGTPVAENFQNLPSLVTVKGESTDAFTKSLESLGYKNCTVADEDSLPKISEWALKQTRDNYPTQLTFKPSKSATQKAYWIKIDRWETTEGLPPEQQPLFKASVDREKNQITVNATGIYSFFIFYNDELVDLDKPVTVVVNNKPHVGTYARSLVNFLEGVYQRNDNRIVFTAAQYYDAPSVTNSGAK